MTERDPAWTLLDAASVATSGEWQNPRANLAFSLDFLLTIAERSATAVLQAVAGTNTGFVTASLTAGNIYYFWLDAPAFSPTLSIYDSAGYRLLGLDGDDIGIADAFNSDSILFFEPEVTGIYRLRFTFSAPVTGGEFAVQGWEDAGGNLYNDFGAGVATVSIAATSAARSEGATGSTPFTFTVTRTGALEYVQSIGWLVLAGGNSPAEDDDFADPGALSGELNFAAGESSKTITIQVAGDTLAEGDEHFSLQLFAPSRGLKVGTGTAEAVILDDDGGANGVVSVTRTAANASEGTGEGALVTFIVSRDAAYTTTHSVRWQIEGIGGAPASASDFAGGALPSGLITFAPGQLTQTVQFRLAGDNLLEPTERFQLRLSDPSGGARLGASTATMDIVDDDSRVSVTAITPSVLEGSGTAVFLRFMVTREDARKEQTVDWGIHGTGADPATGADFAGGFMPSGRIAFAVGEVSRTISVQLVTDSTREADETLEMRLIAPFGGVGFVSDRAAAAILNDDADVVFDAAPLAVLEGDTGSAAMIVTLERHGYLAVAADIGWAVTATGPIATRADANDFVGGVLPSGTVHFAAGAGAASFVIPIAGDTLVEASEQFGVTLTRGAGISLPQRTVVAQLLDDEAWIGLDPAPVTATEGEEAVFTLRRSLPTDAFQSVSWSVLGGAGVPAVAADFAGGALPSGSVTFAPGETEREIRIATARDSGAEAAEGFRLLLGAAAPGVVLRGTEAAGTILDAPEPAWLSIVADQPGVIEGDAGVVPITFTVTRSGDLAAAGSVAWSFYEEANVTTWHWPGSWPKEFAGGILPSGVLHFATGETAKTITVGIAGDSEMQPDVVFGLKLSNPSAGFALQKAQALATILNDETELIEPDYYSAPEITEGDEGFAALTATLTRVGFLGESQSVSWRVRPDPLGPTDADAEDFWRGEFPSGTLTFAPGVATAIIRIRIASDTVFEEVDGARLESVWVDLEASAGLSGATAFLAARIRDDDSGFKVVGLYDKPLEGSGENTTHNVAVERIGNLSTAATVEWRAVALGGPGSAQAADFAGGIMPSGILSYAAGQSFQSIRLELAGDGIPEASESFALQLFNPSAGFGVSPAPAIVTINDDDAFVSIAATAAGSVEGDVGSSLARFTLTRSGFIGRSQTVTWSVEPAGANLAGADDFAGRAFPTGTTTFAYGETSRTIAVSLRGETLFEANEGYLVRLTSASAGLSIAQATARATILNDDTAVFASIAAPMRNEGSGADTNYTFFVHRRGNLDQAQGVDWAIGPTGEQRAGLTDFPGGTFPSGRVEFAPSETVKAVTVPVKADRIIEADETFLLRLSNPSPGLTIGQPTALATIRNDDALVTAVADLPTVAEGTGGTTPVGFTLTRTGDLSVTHAVSWAAVGTGAIKAATNDFAGNVVATGRVSFAPGETTQQVVVQVEADARVEGDESFVLRLAAPSAGLSVSFAQAIAIILDDDAPVATLSDWML